MLPTSISKSVVLESIRGVQASANEYSRSIKFVKRASSIQTEIKVEKRGTYYRFTKGLY